MTTTASTVTGPLDERLFQATIGTLELFGVYLGTRLGLYRVVADHGPVTPPALADAADIDVRYAREWLEQQAVAGVLTADDAGAADERRYTLPEAHRGVLVDPEDAAHVAPFAGLVVGIAGVLDDVVDAYRSGGGVPYARYGRAFREGQGAINRPAFTADLLTTWLPGAGLGEPLARPGARVADLGCGVGWASVAVARAHPQATVVGVDADAPSIEAAAAHAREQGVGNVTFLAEDAARLTDHGPFDVILILEVLHDLARPVEALAACRSALRDGGAVLVADEAVAERFTAPGDDLERMMYGWSITHCLPAGRAEPGSAATGTVIRPDTVRKLATDAGFGRAEVVDVDGGFFRLYRLDP